MMIYEDLSPWKFVIYGNSPKNCDLAMKHWIEMVA